VIEGPADESDAQFHRLAHDASNYKSIRQLLLSKIRKEVQEEIENEANQKRPKMKEHKLSVIDPTERGKGFIGKKILLHKRKNTSI
jgi:hypothetical protein